MMGPRQVAQGALFYEFSIEGFVPLEHPVRGIDRFLDLSDVRNSSGRARHRLRGCGQRARVFGRAL